VGTAGDRAAWAADAGLGSPMASRMVVGMRLRRLREEAGWSREEAGEAIQAPVPEISRMESGRATFRLRDVAGLCTFYGIADQSERTMLLGLAWRASGPGWWQPYLDVIPDWFEAYLGLEQAAQVIRCYEVQFIPGLLQTEDYARAVLRLGHPGAAEAEIDRRVELRMLRQDILGRSRPVRLWAVIGEAALRDPAAGGRAVLRAQLRHLIAACDMPYVTIGVLPSGPAAHPAAGSPVSLLRLPGRLVPEVVYREQLTTAAFCDSDAERVYYRHMLDQLAIRADSAGSGRELLSRILRDA
jgi:transcriptional regulator with XRE-family HTH domain